VRLMKLALAVSYMTFPHLKSKTLILLENRKILDPRRRAQGK
jgi:hypothetical protein